MSNADKAAIERELDRIRPLGLEELRFEWRRLFHSDAPKISRDLLALGVGYRLQELEQGGLGKATRRKLQTLANGLRRTGRIGATASLSSKPGARLIREWHGRARPLVRRCPDAYDTRRPQAGRSRNENAGHSP